MATSFYASATAGDGHRFGPLTNGFGEEVSFVTDGVYNSNTDFMYTNWGWFNEGNFESVTIGLNAFGTNEPAPNNGYDTFHVQAGAEETSKSGHGLWGFKWSITGAGGSVRSDIFMAFRIEGPSAGSWGDLSTDFAAEVVGYPASAGTHA